MKLNAVFNPNTKPYCLDFASPLNYTGQSRYTPSRKNPTVKNPVRHRRSEHNAALQMYKSLLSLLQTLTCILLVATSQCFASTVEIKHAITSQDPKEQLVLSILKLALSKANNGQNYQFEELTEYTTEARLLTWIGDGTLDVMWAGTQPKYEKELYPIRIPIFKGMLGHRIFIIREGDQGKFDKVQSLDDLRAIPLGQGRYWGDTAVLKNANMTVVDPVKYKNLFPMLEGGRFDFFPRAIHEPWSEVEMHKELNLTVEKNLLLVYPFAMYFFVSRENPTLAQAIQTGFRNAIDDGSYDDLLFNHPEVKKTLQYSNLKNRTVFRLSNPNMTKETPVDDTSLWLNLEDL
ncbi:hypothetical protein TDB9533_00440 [Thalassocella blandensis]|nr:hypothetical protein TDB9533_00440 [Thalassocella blandensis]